MDKISKLRILNNQLADSEDRLILAINSAEIGIWDWYIEEDKLVWNQKMLDIFGMTNDEFTGHVNIYREKIHPDDVAEVFRLVDIALYDTGKFARSYRISVGDGVYKNISAKGKVLYDSITGKPYRMIGVAWENITEV